MGSENQPQFAGIRTPDNAFSVNPRPLRPLQNVRLHGQQYAILVDYPEAPPFEDGILEAADWIGATGNAYPGGGPWCRPFDGGATWQSFASEGFDVHFRTFVIPN